jgi:hypothetical protein
MPNKPQPLCHQISREQVVAVVQWQAMARHRHHDGWMHLVSDEEEEG